MSLKRRWLPVAAVVATVAAAGPVFAVADDRGGRQYLEAEDVLPALEGAESELPAGTTERTPGQAVARREERSPQASGNAVLAFVNESVGNRFTVRFPVEASDAYDVVVRPTTGPDHGIVRMAIDGRSLGESVDLSAAEPGRADELTLGRIELAAGDHTLTVTVEKAGGGLRAGLDYIELVP